MYIPAGLAFNNFIVVTVIVATLYFAREILVPISLAVLLSFVLAPLVKLFQQVRVPRPVAVVLAVIAALAVAISLGTMVMLQVNQLVSDLPRYQTTLGQSSQFASNTRSKWQSRSRNSAQGDKWSFCLTAGTLMPANQERR